MDVTQSVENLQRVLIPVGNRTETSLTTHLPSVSVARTSNSLYLHTNESNDPSSQTTRDSSTSVLNNGQCITLPQKNSFDAKPSPGSPIEMDCIVTGIGVNQQQRAQRDSRCLSVSVLSTTSEGAICRICHEGEEKEDLLSPCHCSGTVGLLHLSCLEKWLGSSSRSRCELCGFEYTVDSQPKPFVEWLRHPASVSDRRNVICDVCCFFLLTPLAAISSWLCLVGARYYSYWTGRWEVPGLISLTVFLICIYLTWCLVVARYHYRIWIDWRRHNQIVRIRAVKRGHSVKKTTVTKPISHPLDDPEGNRENRDSHSSEALQTENNNNNNAVSIEVDDEEEDVVVEVTGGAGQRGSYRLLSDSSNLVCSPNRYTVCSRRHSSSSPARTKLHSISFSPGKPKHRSSSVSSAEGEVTVPLLGHMSGGEPPRGRHRINRSLMLDPAFAETPHVSVVRSTMVTYQNLTDDVFTTVVDPVKLAKVCTQHRTVTCKESYV